MTDEERASQLAYEFAYYLKGDDHIGAGDVYDMLGDRLRAFAEAVRADERERCARALETRDVYVAAAAFVRARGVVP